MKKLLFTLSALVLMAESGGAQEISVSPSSANVYSQGTTSVLLTFGRVKDKRPVDACFCGELIPAEPDAGMKCNPEKVFGYLPVRYDQSRRSGDSSYTDVISIPASVARRAYLDAAAGAEGTFYYVRRFVSTVGGPDEYVPVMLRLSGSGAGVPFSLTDVKLSWGVGKPVLIVKAGEKLPRVQAEITYTGTGRLKGRWEIAKPGDELPREFDLLTEATLPLEERALQRRYTEMSRFNVYLPPTGKFVLPGPEQWRVPTSVDGLYLVLLRIEATDMADGASDVQGGAVAGFALPVLRYYVGGADPATAQPSTTLAALSPDDNAAIDPQGLLEFRWSVIEQAALYRLEIQDSSGGEILSALLAPDVTAYRAPSWLREKSVDGQLRWRVIALDQTGKPFGESAWRNLKLNQ